MSRLKRTAIIVLVAAFIAFDLLLLAFVLSRSSGSPDEQATEPAPTSATSAAPTPAQPNGSTELIYQSGVLVRLTRGQCAASGRPQLEISGDLGATFNELALPLLGEVDSTELGANVETVHAILGVTIDSPTEMTVVATDADCKQVGYSTEDAGQSWQRGDVPAGWFVDAVGTGVISPEGSSEPGCDVVALSPVSDRNAKVACANGVIRGTNDFGGEWVILGRLDGVNGAAFTDLRTGFAIAPDGECRTRAFSTADAGGSWRSVGCVAPDTVGTSLVGDASRLFALVGGEVHLSTDGGKTWQNQEAD